MVTWKYAYRLIVLAFMVASTIPGCSRKEPEIMKDFSTPEGAILCLEDAYRAKNLEAAIAAKDFVTEAQLMLEETYPNGAKDKEILRKTAEALKSSYIHFIKQDGFPDFNGLVSTFVKKEEIRLGIVKVTEKCVFPDGGYSIQSLLVAKTENGWRVLNVVDDKGKSTQVAGKEPDTNEK
jgi:hypothetical protein